MATKTFKLGEYAVGGIITAETKGDNVTIIVKEWDMSTGTRKSSNQSNAKEFTRRTFDVNDNHTARELFMFLGNMTTSYYADEIIKWIKSKTKLKSIW